MKEYMVVHAHSKDGFATREWKIGGLFTSLYEARALAQDLVGRNDVDHVRIIKIKIESSFEA